MDLIWTIYLLLLLIILISIFVLFIYSGLFTPIDLRVGGATYDELLVACKTFKGNYSNIGTLFTEAYSITGGQLDQIGIYFDDPKICPPDECRSMVGVILKGAIKRATENMKQAYLREGYKLLRLPKPQYVLYTRFPHATFLSIYLSIWRVYPLLTDYLQENGLKGHPYVEIYDGKEICYFVPLDHQSDFYPPEFKTTTDDDYGNSKEFENEAQVLLKGNKTLTNMDVETESSGSSFEEVIQENCS